LVVDDDGSTAVETSLASSC